MAQCSERGLGETDVFRQRWYWATILTILFGLQLFSLVYYVREQRALTDYLDQVTRSSLPPSQQIQDIVLSLKSKKDNGNDSYFLFPVFSFLRPTPLQVIEQGGDCADRSRLVIALLRLRDIPASKWALYNARGESVHAVVQANVESGSMVVDPLFGIWFPKPQGGYYAIGDLRKDPQILSRRISALRAQGLEPGADRLETYKSDDYVYTNARTINWNKSALMKYSYRLLRWFMDDKVDELHRPAFVEEPPLMVIYGIAVLEAFVILAWFLMARMSKKASA
jgi:hypothetical protein